MIAGSGIKRTKNKYISVNFSVEFKNGDKLSIATPGEVSTEDLNESNESEKTGHIKTVFKQLFKCAFYCLF